MAANANIGISIVTGGAVYTPPLSYELQTKPQHVCGQCKTPFGKSTIPCENDPETHERRRAAVREAIARANETRTT